MGPEEAFLVDKRRTSRETVPLSDPPLLVDPRLGSARFSSKRYSI